MLRFMVFRVRPTEEIITIRDEAALELQARDRRDSDQF